MKKQKFPINLFLPYLGFYSAQAIFGTYLNLYLNDVGFSKTQMGMFTSLSTLLVLIVQPLWGYVSDRSKTKNRILNLLLIAGATTILGFYLNINYWWIMVVNCLFCVFYNPVPPLLDNLSLETLESGVMTGDLAGLVEEGFQTTVVDSERFLDAIAQRLAEKLV